MSPGPVSDTYQGPDDVLSAFAVYTWSDGRKWDTTDAIALYPGQTLQEAADAAFERHKGGMAPARLVSVEVVYKGRRAKAVA